MKFVVEGKMSIKGKSQPFAKEIDAADAKSAQERAYTLIGSDHHLQRTLITVTSVKELSG